ncbi:MAG TPA: TIGR03621 family F420-dependent LLM class oxidoreductase [Ktedonobacterales bacterium]
MANARPFRFGVGADSAPSREAWIELAQKVEDLGYATFLLADHYVNEFPPIAALMAAADAAKTIRVGSFVFDNDFRHPAMLAKEVATLDLLSGGRFEFGIGAGWHPPEYEQAGLPFDSAGVRISRLEEALAIIKQFFTQDAVTFSGAHYRVTNLYAAPKPAQRPYPPIFIGGGGKRLLTLAGREADIIGLHFKVSADGTVSPSEHTEAVLAQKVEWVRQAAGERFEAIEFNLLVGVGIAENRQKAAEQRVRERGLAVTAEQVLASSYLLLGSVEEIVERLHYLRERYGVSYFVVGTEYMEALAPVVARLAGK